MSEMRPGLTLREFLEKVKFWAAHLKDYQLDNSRVCIPLAQPSMGAQASVPVTNVSSGFDWDAGTFFIHTEKPVTTKGDKQAIYESAHDLLMHLATKPSKRKDFFTRDAQNILKRNGCTDEDFEKYRYLYWGSQYKVPSKATESKGV